MNDTMVRCGFFLLAIVLILSLPVRAENANSGYFGLAMTGAPKYGPNAAHLDYANPDAPKGGTLHLAGLGSFDTLNPYSIKGNAPKEGLNLVYDKLMARVWDEPFTLYPLIAESAEVPEDRSSITFHINPKARFSNGSPIAADDVLFSYETLKNEGRPNMRSVYKLAQAAEKIDNRTVKFSFGEGRDRETPMIFAMMPVLSKAYWSGKKFDSATLEVPVTSGPYKITSVDPGRQIVYTRDPDYWAKDLFVNRGHYNPDKIIYDFYRNDTVALEAFKAGNVDLRREVDPGKWASNYDFPAAHDGRVILEEIPHQRTDRTLGFIFNTRRPPFDDIRVRKALNLLFDFEWVNQNIFHGQYKRTASYFPNSELAASGMPNAKELDILNSWKERISDEAFGPAWTPPSNKTQDERRKNMVEANRLLNEAGWSVQNGKRVKNGKAFVFEILLSAPEDEKVALNFKNALARMGITANIRVLDAANYRSRMTDYDFDMALDYWQNSLSPGTEQMLYWSCKAAKEPSRWNYAGICSPAVDALAAAIPEARDRETMVAMTRAMDRVLMSGYYIIPLYFAGKDYVAHWNKLERPEKTGLYGMVLETWWIRPEGRAP